MVNTISFRLRKDEFKALTSTQYTERRRLDIACISTNENRDHVNNMVRAYWNRNNHTPVGNKTYIVVVRAYKLSTYYTNVETMIQVIKSDT